MTAKNAIFFSHLCHVKDKTFFNFSFICLHIVLLVTNQHPNYITTICNHSRFFICTTLTNCHCFFVEFLMCNLNFLSEITKSWVLLYFIILKTIFIPEATALTWCIIITCLIVPKNHNYFIEQIRNFLQMANCTDYLSRKEKFCNVVI